MMVLLPLCCWAAAAAAAAGSAAAAGGSRPHVISILQDDLGFADTGIHGGDGGAAAVYTQNITALARQGIALTHHYVHWHCSPTRRTFLSGRLPIHHGEQLSGVDTDDMDLRWTWLPAKLQAAGYRTHGFGKMHTGFKSTKHLWHNRGFTSAVGSLLTGGDYYNAKYSAGVRWQNDHPLMGPAGGDTAFEAPPPDCTAQAKHPGNGSCVNEYSTALWGQMAIQAVVEHSLPDPLYIHLCFQAVHEPYDAPPGKSATGVVYHDMLWDADVYVGKLVAALKARQMWENLLVIYSADNGGTGDGIK